MKKIATLTQLVSNVEESLRLVELRKRLYIIISALAFAIYGDSLMIIISCTTIKTLCFNAFQKHSKIVQVV